MANSMAPESDMFCLNARHANGCPCRAGGDPIFRVSQALWRELSLEEEADFRAWARTNWTLGDEINELWHPVVRDEIAKMAHEDHDERRDPDCSICEAELAVAQARYRSQWRSERELRQATDLARRDLDLGLDVDEAELMNAIQERLKR